MAELRHLEELASRVSDGEAVDWAAERRRARNAGELRLVEALASLDRIAVVMRSEGATPEDATETATLEETDATVGSVFGPYRIEEHIGRGGMGSVYRAYDTRLDRSVAVKLLAPELAADEAASRRFLRETRLACRVSHPYVAMVHDVLEDDGRVMLVMEWIRGRTLERLLAEGPLPPRRAASLGAEIAEALEAVHRGGIVHRDLKPANVMLSADGHVKVMDFGVALHVFRPVEALGATPESRDRLTAENRRVGTVRYMSPEQLRGETVDARSDLFALGIVLWEMLTGSHPFIRPTTYETAAAILNDPPGPEVDAVPLPEVRRLREVVLRLLEKDPAARFGSAAEVAAELRSIASSADVEVRPAPPVRRMWPRIVGVALLVIAVAAGVRAVQDRRHRDVVPPGLPVVVVLPFEDRDGGSGSVRGELVASLVVAGLSESRAARPVDVDRAVEAYGPHAAARDVAAGGASQVRAGWIVGGQVWTENATLAGMVRIYKAGTGEPVAEHPLRAGGPSGLAAIAAARAIEAIAPGSRGSATALAAAASVPDDAREQLVRARAALRAADYATAIAALERAVAIAPGFVEARTALAEALYQAGWGRRSREEAARAVKDAESAGTSLPPRALLEARAVGAQVQEKADDERTARRALIERYRDDPVLLTAYADAVRRSGRADEALGIVSQAEALDPGDVRTLLEKARVLTGAQRYDDAVAVLAQAEKSLGPGRPPDSRARVAMQQGHLEMSRAAYPAAAERYGKAEGLFREAGSSVRAARAHRSILDAQVVQGKLTVGAADYEPPLNAFRSAGALQDVVDTLNVVGGRDFLAGEYAKAEPTLRLALHEGRILENPELLVYPQLNLAALLNMTARSAEAEGIASEAIEASRAAGLHDPEAFGLTILAQAKDRGGRLVEARDAFGKIVDLERAPGASGERLGVALMETGALDEILGSPMDGLTAADQAVKELRARNQSVELTYALIVRARLRSQVADWEGSETDLAEAEKLAAAAGAPVEDEKLRLALARAGRALRQGRWQDAAGGYEVVRRKAAKVAANELVVPAAIGSCQAQLALGRLTEAEPICRAADADPLALPHERCDAHALLGEIALRRKRDGDAERWARRSASEAHDFALVPTELRALATLRAIPGLPDRAETASRGIALLKGYLESIPEARRGAVRSRADWKTELERFDRPSAAD